MSPLRFAAIDLGSNTFRCLIAEAAAEDENPPWRTVRYRHHIVRLAENLRQTGELAEVAMQRGLAALADFRQLLDAHDVPVVRCRAVATAAMRMASNAGEFQHRVLSATGIDIDIISGDDEARLSLQGCCAALDVAYREDMLLMDIGGGSTEFIRARDGKAEQMMSCPLGVVALTESFLRSDPPSDTDYQAMLEACQPHLAAVEECWQGKPPPATFVGTAGTVTTLAATVLNLHPYDASVINNTRMSWGDFCTLRQRLCALSHAERQKLPTVEPERADLIIAGCAITEAVWRRWGYQDLIIVDAGLLEGVWMGLR